uniref:bifunctional diaminohydroxyphosphoribosylaminopyrimidine deaminase/5-amino-6-(5-phosphoribosylamino)uracil reductase RibD n=1 Tax=Pararhizobium sp. IMCC3301 TaxID=3067904 RepID=UPI0027406D5D|nr:bifunctional diaminohydroxyphosphoribosylaminopyrimidine deaminase/5-amino-6-(5-phosphoribosylamino)uracil reductase RibD [Pararhizobium sp. IMCC3301]
MTSPVSNLDLRFAAAALRFGRRHEGLTSPNPCVAAIVVRKTGDAYHVVGRGVTGPDGRPHAEAQALLQAAAEAVGATLYVTLEPCSHHGMTPPCTDAILSSGIARVVACTADPDPRVAGAGFARLKAAGVTVVTPVLEPAARRFHAGHIAARLGLGPHVVLKLAVSSDGMIGLADAGQVAITGPETWNYVHALRAASDAILVGVGTIISDDPSLTCRLPGLAGRSPLRVVLDSGNRLPANAAILQDQSIAETRIFEGRSCEQVLEVLARQGIQTVMIEGGARVARAFLKAGLVNACHLIRSRDSFIGSGGVAAPLELILDADRFEEIDSRQLGADRLTLLWRKG